jgi:hypothetical protein
VQNTKKKWNKQAKNKRNAEWNEDTNKQRKGGRKRNVKR